MKIACKACGRTHTHTHTHGNLINKKTKHTECFINDTYKEDR